MRKLFSSQGLTLVSALVCVYVLNMFMNLFSTNQSQISMIIKEWLSHLLNI